MPTARTPPSSSTAKALAMAVKLRRVKKEAWLVLTVLKGYYTMNPNKSDHASIFKYNHKEKHERFTNDQQPTLETLFDIAEELGVDVYELLVRKWKINCWFYILSFGIACSKQSNKDCQP